MEAHEYAKLAELEGTYWWHVARHTIIKRLLLHALHRDPLTPPTRSLLLNIGSGTGGTVPLLREFGEVLNVEVSFDALRFSQTKGVENLICATGTALPFEDNSIDLAVSLDVLEHIKDDSAALAEWYRVLKPGSLILITVPAYQWLWSSHDESLRHYRRYHAAGLHRLLNLAGFKVERRTYAITFLLPLIVGYRLLRSLIPERAPSSSYVLVPRLINNFFIFLLKFEALLLRLTNLPFGTSVMIVARKP